MSKSTVRIIKTVKPNKQWQFRNMAEYLLSLNRQEDAATVKGKKAGSLPVAMLPMVF